MKFKLIKYLWNEGVKKHLVTPGIKWFGILIGGYGCYDYGKYESIINPIDPAVKESLEVIFLTQFQNLIKWVIDGRVIEFITITINNISKYLQLPFYIVTYGIIIISIFFLFGLSMYIYRKMFKKNNEKPNEIFNIYEETLYKHLDKQIQNINKEEIQKLEIINKQLLDKTNLLNKEKESSLKKVNELEQSINSLKKEFNLKVKGLETFKLKNEKELKKLVNLNKNLKKQLTSKQKNIRDLQNKLKKFNSVVKGKRSTTQRKNLTAKKSYKKVAVKESKKLDFIN